MPIKATPTPGSALITPSDHILILIDFQSQMAFATHSIDAITLRSTVGSWTGLARPGPMKERHLQAYWPETNVLIPRRFDPVSGEPDYNALVTLEPAGPAAATTPVPVSKVHTIRPRDVEMVGATRAGTRRS